MAKDAGKRKEPTGGLGLVLTRYTDEKIIIGLPGVPPVVVTVVAIRGDRVRLGIRAAASVEVHRHEIWAEVQRERGLLAPELDAPPKVKPATPDASTRWVRPGPTTVKPPLIPRPITGPRVVGYEKPHEQ